MIVDASVALKWALTEPDSEIAERLIGRNDLAAPAILYVELGYTLTKLSRRRLIAPADALAAWQELRQAEIVIYDDDALLDPAFELSLALHASFYDCVYLALAIETDDHVVSADEHFIQGVRSSPGLGRRVQSLAETVS